MRVPASAVTGGERARRTIAPRFTIPRAWPNVALAAIALGSALAFAAGDQAVRLAGVALLGVGAFHMGSLGTPDPSANHRANVAERALLQLGLGALRTPGPAGPAAGEPDAGEPVRVTPQPVRGRYLRARRTKGTVRPGAYGSPGASDNTIVPFPGDDGAPIGVEA